MGTMLITRFTLTRGRFKAGRDFEEFSMALIFSPFATRATMSTMLEPAAGPTTPSKRTSLVNLPKLISGKQPATTSFFFGGARFKISIILFSVGPFTAHVL